MLLRIVIMAMAALLTSCNPQSEQVSIGTPAARALKTTELAADGKDRLNILAAQTDLTNNAIFANYRPKTVSQWNEGWTRRIDFSGVSWSHRQAGTVITPRHLVFAAHFPIKTGTTLTFHDRTGKVHSRKLIKNISLRKKSNTVRSDITIALLDEPLPPSIKTYRLLPPREDYGHTLLDCPVIVTEQGRRAFIHKVYRASNKTISFKKNEDFPESLYKNLIRGDSGNPSFLLVGGEPVLIETHTGGGPGSGPFYSAPLVFKALEEAVAKLDPNYKIKTVPLDPQLAPAPPKKEKPTVPTRPTRPSSLPPTTKEQPNSPKKRTPRVRRVPPVSE